MRMEPGLSTICDELHSVVRSQGVVSSSVIIQKNKVKIKIIM